MAGVASSTSSFGAGGGGIPSPNRSLRSGDAKPSPDALVRGREAAGPLVAHRVPGVGTMPYERWGFALLQGWDGTKEASSPTAMERDPPVGTLWALELSLREGASKKRQPVPGRAASAPSDLKASVDTTSTGRS